LAGGEEGVVVQLLGDDLSTWLPWAMSGYLVAGLPLAPPLPAAG